MSAITLEQRLQRFEDVDAIYRLKARHSSRCDVGWAAGERTAGDRSQLSDVFTADALWDAGGPVFEGIDAIEEAFRDSVMAVHVASSPSIEVAGDEATGEWHEIVAYTGPGQQAMWIVGKYFDRYVRTPDGWRIREARFVPAFMTPYEEGWAKAPFPKG